MFYDVFNAVNGSMRCQMESELGELWAERTAGEELLTVIMVTRKQRQ